VSEEVRDERAPLRAVPLVVKDCFVDGDRKPTLGSRAHAHWLSGTATVLQRVRDAGAAVVGYANLHEWMVGTTSLVSAFGPVINPRNRSLISGGSSGGCAAALAANLVPMAIGSDAGGSIRIPAACCGIVGLKPSWNLVPTDGFVDHGSLVDHVGPMASSVRDVRRLLEVLSGASLPLPRVDELRIGVARSPFFEDADADVARVVSRAVDRLRPHVASVTDVSLQEVKDSGSVIGAFILRDVARMLEREVDGWRDFIEEPTARVLERGAAVTDDVRAWAEDERRRIIEVWERAFENVDVIVTPTLPGRIATSKDRTVALRAGLASAETAYVAWNSPMNLGGVPCLSLPCGALPDGESVNLSLTAARGRDAATIAVGGVVESLR
jgi:aspartyl-tRNA(Asn)/glutamyl-tRNA(Gln) amidotransferase subunit A